MQVVFSTGHSSQNVPAIIFSQSCFSPVSPSSITQHKLCVLMALSKLLPLHFCRLSSDATAVHLMCTFTHSSCRYLLNFEHTCAVLWAFSSPWKRHYRTFQCQVGSRELRNLLIIWNSTFLPDTAVQKPVQTASSVVGGSVPPLLNYFLVVCCQSMGSEARGM